MLFQDSATKVAKTKLLMLLLFNASLIILNSIAIKKSLVIFLLFHFRLKGNNKCLSILNMLAYVAYQPSRDS